jgi:hypothetical protein
MRYQELIESGSAPLYHATGFYAAWQILNRGNIEASDNSYDRDDRYNISTTRNPRLRYYSVSGVDSPGHAPIQFVINSVTVAHKHKIVPYDYVYADIDTSKMIKHSIGHRSESEEKIIADKLPINHIVTVQLFTVPKDFEPNEDDEYFLKENGGYRKTYQLIIGLAKQNNIKIEDFRRKKKRS